MSKWLFGAKYLKLYGAEPRIIEAVAFNTLKNIKYEPYEKLFRKSPFQASSFSGCSKLTLRKRQRASSSNIKHATAV